MIGGDRKVLRAQKTEISLWNCKLLTGLLLLIGSWLVPAVLADPPPAEIPVLSLESIYHPENKFEFAAALPEVRWIGDAPARLLVQRDEKWMEFDLPTATERESPIAAGIAERIAKLGGLSEQQILRATSSAIRKMKLPSDQVVVQIDKSLAVVAADAPARWLTREGSTWGDPTIDSLGRRVGYTQEGDLFLVDSLSGQTHRLTNDGGDTILNGVLDWTYQEEIFGRGNYKGFWFSADGNWLAMLRIDISAIEPYMLSSSGDERGRGIVRRYPKAGDPIPHASLWVWDLRNLDSAHLPPSKRIALSTPEQQRIITGVWWCPNRLALIYSISDRRQSWRELRIVEAAFFAGQSSEADLLLREESSTWVEPPTDPVWLDDGSLVWRSELPTGRNRLYHIDLGGRVVTPMSPEAFHVGEFSVTGDGTIAVVTGNADRNTIEQQAYRIDSNQPADLIPVTKEAGWHRIDVSPDEKWFVDRFSAPAQPPALRVRSVDGDRQQLIAESVLRLREPILVPQLMQIPAPDGVMLPCLLVRPSTASSQRPCPVVIEVYGGPQAPLVSSRWAGARTLYRQLLASRGIATLVIDNRSSAGRGSIESWPIQRRVGEVELQDLLSGVDWLKQQDWVDSRRLAIRGWSFGGFLTLYAMTHSDAFVAGIAGGSVTDWREYDAFYTERYMGLPTENAAGYESTAPVRQADQLHGRVLLIHGESDDNVHPSETLRMAAALQRAGKDFRLMIYPGAAHGVKDPQQLWHLNQMTDRFLMEQLLAGREAGP